MNRAYWQKNKERLNVLRKSYPSYGKWWGKQRTKGRSVKKDVMAHYGSVCACCGENNIAFLTIDHINDDSHIEKAHRKHRLKGESLYRFLNKSYPDNVRVLCFNCNIGRYNNKGICPHKVV